MISRFINQTLIIKSILITVVLGFVCLCSMSTANAGRIQDTSTDLNTVNSQEKKDLSELGSKLKLRFSQIWQEVAELLAQTVADDQTYFSGNIDQSINQVASKKVVLGDNYYNDIDYSIHKDSILILSQLDIVSRSQKFYPDNYLRTYEAITMLAKTSLYLNDEMLLSIQMPDIQDLDNNSSYSKYIAYAYQKGYLDDLIKEQSGNLYINPNHQLTKSEVYDLLNKFSSKKLITDDISIKQKISRAEFSDLIVKVFGLSVVDTDNSQNIQISKSVQDDTINQKPSLLQFLLASL